MIYIIILSSICIFLYSSMLIWFIAGNLINKASITDSRLEPISVIIAIRNGEKSLPKLIHNLKSQDYKGPIEFILVDDDSEDDTKKIINNIVKDDSRFKYESSHNGNDNLNHKKRALDAGIKIAQYEWLLFTDVDCNFKINWISSMAKYFTEKNDYIIGFSGVEIGSKNVTQFQSIDYLILMICANGTTNLGSAWASSGQNQAYRKSLFNQVGGFNKISNELQGDDSLFLQICRKFSSINIQFVEDSGAQTLARQEQSWKSLLNQRMRWSNDMNIMWKFNFIFYFFAVITFSLQILIFILLFNGLFKDTYYLWILSQFLFIKLIFEFLLYIIGTKKLSKPLNLIHFINWFFIQIPYVLLMGLGTILPNKISWKGR